AATATDVSFLTFKSKSCENLSQNYQAEMFGTDSETVKYLPNIGVMIVKMDVYKLIKTIHTKSEFHECIKDISKDEIIKIDDPVIKVSPNEDREQWQLKRINVRKLPLPDKYTRFEVKDVPSHVYVIDSGIDGKHEDFKGRLAPVDEHKTFTSDICACDKDGALCDCNGHGTHCAGLVASPNAGYNLNTTLHSGKVFNWMGSASYAIILESMEWVIEAHKKHSGEAGIVSMSLGGGKNTALNQAVAKIHEAGMLIVVAAGNSDKDSCSGSPSSSPEAYTVGASEIDDSRAYFSEWG
ncbi:MAG: S8 family serine peptidase, partial [bacterium]|nr:S8 family serine peptidase [bacterium]